MRYTLLLAALIFPVAAQAEPYPSTLGATEQERHEFFDVQKENYPSGRDPHEGRVQAPATGTVTGAPFGRPADTTEPGTRR